VDIFNEMADFAVGTQSFPPSWSATPQLNYFSQMLTAHSGPAGIGAAIREIAAHVKEHCSNAIVLYNDYGALMRPLHAGSTSTNVDSKRAKMMATIDVINSGTDTRGYIDGVAFQSHFGCDSVSDWSADGLRAVRDDIVDNMAAFVARGVSTHISEIDWVGCLGSDDRWKILAHLQFSACFNQPACSTVGIWGVADPFRWQQGGDGGLQHHTLFGVDGRPHPSYFGLVDALLGQKPTECATPRSEEMRAYCSLPVLPTRAAIVQG